MFVVLFERVRVDENVVDVSNDKLVQKRMKGCVDVGLKCRRRVGQPERHDTIFEMAIAGAECSLPFVTVRNPKEVISCSEIDFGIILGIFDTIEEF